MRNRAISLGASLLVWLCCFGSAYAAQSKPIVWQPSGDSPYTVCSSAGYGVSNLTYGSPTSYRCVDANGGYVGGWRFATPTCETGYEADFSKVLCVASTVEVSDQWLKAIVVCIGVCAFGVGLVAGQQR